MRAVSSSGRWCSLGLALLLCLAALAPALAAEKREEKVVLRPAVRLGRDTSTRAAFDSLYNGDYTKAVRAFELIQRAHPNDPRALNWLTTAVLFQELYRTGALDTELFADAGFMNIRHAPVDPAVRARIRQLNDAALALCDRRLREEPDDVQVLYARGVARGTRSLITGMLDRSWLPALSVPRRLPPCRPSAMPANRANRSPRRISTARPALSPTACRYPAAG